REDDRLLFPITGLIAGDDELDADTGDRITEVLAPGERRQIPASFELTVNGVISCAGHDEVDSFGRPPIAVCRQRHPVVSVVGDAEFVQPAGNFPHRCVYGALVLEVHAPLAQSPVEVLVQPVFVGDRSHAGIVPVPAAARTSTRGGAPGNPVSERTLARSTSS